MLFLYKIQPTRFHINNCPIHPALQPDFRFCNSAMCFTIDNLSPVPSIVCERALSRSGKSAQNATCSSAGMPMPLSQNRNMQLSPFRCASTIIFPPSGCVFDGIINRFTKMERNISGSPTISTCPSFSESVSSWFWRGLSLIFIQHIVNNHQRIKRHQLDIAKPFHPAPVATNPAPNFPTDNFV